nr:hypothetical protein [Tanacetum cinerariifolium]
TPTEPVDSLSMGNEHLDIILATESDEFIKSCVENLVPNPSESEGKNECDVPAGFTTFSNVLFDDDYDSDSSDDQLLSDEDVPEKIYSNLLFDEEIIHMEIDQHSFNVESDLIESMPNHDSSVIISLKIDSLFSNQFRRELIKLIIILRKKFILPRDCCMTTHLLDSDPLMEEIDLSFNPDDPMPPGIEEDDDDSERDIPILKELLDNYSLSLPTNESYHFDILLPYRPPTKPPDGNTGTLNIKMMGDVFDQKENFNGMSIEIRKKEKLLQEEQWAYLSTHPSKRLHSFCFDDDDEDYTSAITPDEPVLSTEEPDNSLSMGDEHLDTIPATKSDEFIKSGVENLIPIPSESEGIPEHMCDVPSHDNSSPLDVSKDQIEDFSESNNSEVIEIVIPEVGGIDDDILLTINHDDLREKLRNVNLLISKLEALNANSTPASDCKTKSSSTSLNSLLEETNTFDNSLPEFETFCFDVEEISSGSTTARPDLSLPEYEAFHDDHIKEFSSGRCSFLSEELPDIDSFNDIYPHFDDDPLSGSTTYSANSLLEEFADELALISYPPDYDDYRACNIKSDIREIEFLLFQGEDSDFKDSIDQSVLTHCDDLFVDPTPEMFAEEQPPDYSFPSRFDVYPDDFLEIESDATFDDDSFDSEGEKIKEAELLIDPLDLPCDIMSEYDSFNSQDFSRDDVFFSPDNEDKVFNPGILSHDKSVKIITRFTPEKKLAVSFTSWLFEDFDPPFSELLVFKEVPISMRLLPFSSENEEKVFKPGIYTFKKFHCCFLPELSHPESLLDFIQAWSSTRSTCSSLSFLAILEANTVNNNDTKISRRKRGRGNPRGHGRGRGRGHYGHNCFSNQNYSYLRGGYNRCGRGRGQRNYTYHTPQVNNFNQKNNEKFKMSLNGAQYQAKDGDLCIADSGATHTILKSKKYLFELKPTKGTINTISSPTNLVDGVRKANVVLPNGTQLLIENALFSSKSKRNLLSFRNIYHNGYDTQSRTIGNKNYLLIMDENQAFETLPMLRCGLHYTHINVPQAHMAVKEKYYDPGIFSLWYDRLGHPGSTMMKKIVENTHGHPLKDQKFSKIDKVPLCTSCFLEKLIVRPSPFKIENESPMFLERIQGYHDTPNGHVDAVM